jgi:hypothetical protein
LLKRATFATLGAMMKSSFTRSAVLALLLVPALLFPVDRAAAQGGREPLACMELALDYAVQLVRIETATEIAETQREALASLNAIAADEGESPSARLREARALMGSREMRDHERAVRNVQRTNDLSRSVVAGWRGLYCPVATPDGASGLTGQDRCNALSAGFVDRMRIDQRTPEQTRAREALETERQTILKLRVTRSDRNDLLDLLRVRSEAFDTLIRLERFIFLQNEARKLIEGVEEAGCAQVELRS